MQLVQIVYNGARAKKETFYFSKSTKSVGMPEVHLFKPIDANSKPIHISLLDNEEKSCLLLKKSESYLYMYGSAVTATRTVLYPRVMEPCRP